MYELPSLDAPPSQGDVIDECPVFALEPSSTEVDPEASPTRWRARVIVLTQACDLAQSKVTRVVVGLVHDAQQLVERGILKPGVIRDQVRRGLAFGWYFFPAASAPLSVPESIVDLRDLHTVSRTVLEWLIAQGKRVYRVVTPYREHLAQHFAVTYSRIGLPEPYESQP